MQVSTIDIFTSLINSMKIELNIKSIVDNEDGTYLLNVCNSQYLAGKYQDSNAYTLTLNELEFDVLEVTDTSVKIKGTESPTIGKYLLPVPKFFHGTITQTNIELAEIDDNFSITPMIYLRRTFTEQRFRNANKDRIVDVTLYFLTQANFTEWQTVDSDRYAVRPMMRLLETFIDYISMNSNVGKFDNYNIQDNIKFARFIDSKGFEKSIFDKHLAGVQLDISLPLSNKIICNC